MQGNENRKVVLGSLMLLAMVVTGCQATGQKAETTVPPLPPINAANAESPINATPDHTTSYAAFDTTPMETPTRAVADRQITCPVTGARLGSMGAPVPVAVNGQMVSVCCSGCVEKLKRNPEKYLAGRDGT